MSFLKQLTTLRQTQPHIALVTVDNENSEYVSYCYRVKNCYLTYASDYDEDCYYSYFIFFCKNCSDCAYCTRCELCFESTDCENCYNCNDCQDCKNSNDLEYCFDCTACKNCFGCVGLRRQEYYIFNQSVNKEEYAKKVAELKKDTPAVLRKFDELKKKTPRLFTHQLNNEDCTGDYIVQSKNSYFCFDVQKQENCLYMNNLIDCFDCVDCSNIYFKNELCYQCVAATYLYNCNFCYSCFESRDLEYCLECYNCQDCFGCVSLKRKQYCLLNEQYTKDEYFKKKAEIIAQMRKEGEYGQMLDSTYPYEDSLAANFWPTA